MKLTKSESKIIKGACAALCEKMYQSTAEASTCEQARSIWEDCKMLIAFTWDEEEMINVLSTDSYVRSMVLLSLDDLMQNAYDAGIPFISHAASFIFDKVDSIGRVA